MSHSSEPQNWWQSVSGATLEQGDLLTNVSFPLAIDPLTSQQEEAVDAADEPIVYADIFTNDLLVMTQSCDFAQGNVQQVILCPVYSVYGADAPDWINSNTKRNDARSNRKPECVLLGSPTSPGDNRSCLTIKFGTVVTLPLSFVQSHANAMGDRWRLVSPCREYVSQAFARYFMRVGLPDEMTISKFTDS